MFLTGKVVTNDQVELRYDVFNPDATRDIVLVHGWSGSRQYFVRNARELATAGFRVISYDLRGHGESQKTSWGFSVHRLAKDLDDVLRYLEVRSACCIGTSMGAAVIWAFFELFGPGRIASVVTVDQAPLQNIAPDWKIGRYERVDLERLERLTLPDLTHPHTRYFFSAARGATIPTPWPSSSRQLCSISRALRKKMPSFA